MVLGACGVAAEITVRRGLPDLTGAPRALAWTTSFTAAVVLSQLVPGVLRMFTPVGVAAAAILVAVTAAAAAPRGPAATPAAGVPEPDPRWSQLLALGAGALTAGCALALVRDVAGAPVTSIDAQNFQVPIVARWLQEDAVWGLHQFIADYSNATYPMNGNVLVAAVALPFESALFARLVAVPYWALSAVALYAVALELRAPRATAALAATAFTALPVMLRAGLEGVQTDAPMLAQFGAGVLFLLRHHRGGHRGDLLLAGVSLGLAFGTKWYAVTSVAAVLALWALARRRRHLLRDGATLVALVAAFGGFWLLRNLVETGNPLFPQPLGPFPAPPDPLREQAGFTLAHYATDLDVWRTYLRPALASAFGWTGAVLAAGAVVASVALARRPRGPAALLAAGALVLAAVYAVTPYGAFGPDGRPVLAAASTRYGLPALMAATVLTAWLATRGARVRVVVDVLLAVAVADGVRRGFDLPAVKVAGGTLLAAAAAVAAPHVRARRLLAAATAALLMVAGLVAAEGVRRRVNETGYGRFDPTLAWIERHASSGARIGLAGVWSTDAVAPPLPAFGPRLGNDVRYLGEFREGMLRAHPGAPAFMRALRDRDLVIVGRGAPPRRYSREERWAQAAGWRIVAQSRRLVLLRRP